MMSQNVKNKISQLSIFQRTLVSGLSGCFGVFCQTMSLLWHFNVIHEQVRIGLTFKSTIKYIYNNCGLYGFFKGFGKSYRTASLARFGDTGINTFILEQLRLHNKLNLFPIFLKSAIVWGFAGTWRLSMMPFLALEDTNNIFKKKQSTRKLLRTMRRIYVKRTKPEILSLYSWFLFHNYFDSYTHPMQYKDSIALFLIRHSIAGFGSMVCYDLFLAAYRKIKQVKGIHNRHNVLLGECESRMFIKGMHGVLFCTTSNLFRLYAMKGKQVIN